MLRKPYPSVVAICIAGAVKLAMLTIIVAVTSGPWITLTKWFPAGSGAVDVRDDECKASH